ncbi:MAG: benzoate-CoA ligase family protein [Deltaproteobacteria bacterium]|nr:benzoate-CoA ligase family protein [Deltaproteobacteria bacterium]
MVKGERLDIFLPEELNLGSFFLDINIQSGRGEKTALYYQDKRITYQDLWVLTNKVGNVLRELGVEPENRILLVLQDSPEWVASWLAAMKIGGVGTHAYTYLKVDDYSYLLDLIRPKVVVADHTTIDLLRKASQHSKYPRAFLVAGEHAGGLGAREYYFNDMVASANEDLEVEKSHRDDLAFWNFSGGTTGKPKGVPHMHRDGVLSFESFNYVMDYTADDVVIRVPKLFFHYARDLGLLFPLRAGASVVLFPERTTAKIIFELVDKFRATVLINVPTMMRAMIQTPENERSDLSCLRRVMSSGEMLSAKLYGEWVDAFGTEVVNRFGSAESAMGYLCNRPGLVVPGSSGTVTPMVEVKIVDSEGQTVPEGQPGVLLCRSVAAALSYVREHEKTLSTFLGNEWINTGDIFQKDENDYFWYLGRADDMVKVSGVWVSPLEIERCLQKHPNVRECAVMGLRDEDGLTKLKAFVALEKESDILDDTADELKNYCNTNLASYKYPRYIEFMEELPKTGQGKIDKRELRSRKL